MIYTVHHPYCPNTTWLAYPLRLAVELGSCVDGEAYGWAWKPYGWFDPQLRVLEIQRHPAFALTAKCGARWLLGDSASRKLWRPPTAELKDARRR